MTHPPDDSYSLFRKGFLTEGRTTIKVITDACYASIDTVVSSSVSIGNEQH